ncbi:MAG: hypothetical protein LBV52_07400 [Spirochaetaceae bacterium]|nr:hypothetical protein [Spirochaetaceae bacterium]
MISPELWALLKRVITSWEVIVCTIAIILFFALVISTANPKQRIKISKQVKIKRPKPKQELPKDVNTEDIGLQ